MSPVQPTHLGDPGPPISLETPYPRAFVATLLACQDNTCEPQPYARLVLSLMAYDEALDNHCSYTAKGYRSINDVCRHPPVPFYQCNGRWLARRLR